MHCPISFFPSIPPPVRVSICISLFFLLPNLCSATEIEWPDTTLVTWTSEDQIASERLVSVLLETGTTKSQFQALVTLNGDSLWWWDDSSSNPTMAIVQIAANEDLVDESEEYATASIVKIGSPIIWDLEPLWPPDDMYDQYQGYLEQINWDDVVNEDSDLRGHEDIKIGILDTGLNGTVTHPDLASDRFVLVRNYFSNSNNLRDYHGHGTGLTSLLAANAENLGPDDEEDWGMVGVNTVSTIYCGKIAEGGWTTNFVLCRALRDLQERYNCDIVSISWGGPSASALWEETINYLIDNDIMPLIVIAAGNSGENGVLYPARYAHWGTYEGYERGYPQIISAGACRVSDGEVAHYSSYTPGYRHVTLLGPGSASFFSGLINAVPNNGGQQWFAYYHGTSNAAPITAGGASLLLTKDLLEHNGDRTLSPWAIRRILEKTANRVSWTDPILDEAGVGVIDIQKAIDNRDFDQFTLTENTWYWISSPVAPANSECNMVYEDLLLDNDDDLYFQRISVIKQWDPINQSEYVYDTDEEINSGGASWLYYNMRKIKLKTLPQGATDSLLLVGNRVETDEPINLYDIANIAGWNWVSYYPDYSESAPNVLTSIATSGQSASHLYLAKGANGNFYAVNSGYSNLTMHPGQGYMMQLDNNENVELIYPEDDPNPAPPHDRNGGEKPLAETEHFEPCGITSDFLPILITGVQFADRQAEAGDEIAAFNSDSICVGAGLFQGEFPIGFAAWYNEPETANLDGLDGVESLTFRYWDRSANEEIWQENFQYRTSNASNLENGSLWIGQVLFGGPIAEQITPSELALDPIFPNPFNAAATVKFSITEPGFVRLVLKDIQGRIVEEILDSHLPAGAYRNAINSERLAAGLYFVQLEAADKVLIQKVGVMK